MFTKIFENFINYNLTEVIEIDQLLEMEFFSIPKGRINYVNDFCF